MIVGWMRWGSATVSKMVGDGFAEGLGRGAYSMLMFGGRGADGSRADVWRPCRRRRREVRALCACGLRARSGGWLRAWSSDATWLGRSRCR